jgi:hypothetical protein
VSSKAFTAQIFRWLHQVNGDPKLPASAVKVALYLSAMFNEAEEDGMAWPSNETIGQAIGRSASNVGPALQQLEVRGHLRVVWGKQGRGHYSRYWMILKPLPTEVSDPPKTSANGGLQRSKTSVSASENLCFDHVKPLPAEVTLSTYSSKEPSNSRAREEDKGAGEEKKAGEAWTSAVALRAHHRIGEISGGLETLGHRPKKGSTDGTQFKRATLKAAGISVASAYRAEFAHTGAKPNGWRFADLQAKLVEAAGDNVERNDWGLAFGLGQVEPILDLINQDRCSLEADILPVIRELVPTFTEPLNTWNDRRIRDGAIARRRTREEAAKRAKGGGT